MRLIKLCDTKTRINEAVVISLGWFGFFFYLYVLSMTVESSFIESEYMWSLSDGFD